MAIVKLKRTTSDWYKGKSVNERFWLNLSIPEDPNACWEWQGSRRRHGYGYITGTSDGKGVQVLAHRLSYEISVGPIPDGLVLDHLCRNTGCVNPAHLEAVQSKVNTLRGNGVTAMLARSAFCKNGHPKDAANSYMAPDGRRRCRPCMSARTAERNRRPDVVAKRIANAQSKRAA